jgi:hypothetical protein
VRNSAAKATWGSAVLSSPKEESEDSSSSSDEESSDDKDDLEAPEGGKEIKSEPPSRGQSRSPGRSERSTRTKDIVRLEPWKIQKTMSTGKRTMTTDKRTVPIKKDPSTKLTKEDVKKSTAELVKIRTEGRFRPMWMRNIPMTLEDFKNKEKTWLGFHYALKNIGLDYDEVKQRLRDNKTPRKDLEEQQLTCQKAHAAH